MLNFIQPYEGLHLTAYWDYKQWTIGYGTKSYKGEKITKEEARKRAIEYIANIRKKWNFYDLPDNVEVAMISFTYNLGHPPKGYRWYLKKGHTGALKNHMRLYVYAGGRKLRGLVKRRNAETNLF